MQLILFIPMCLSSLSYKDSDPVRCVQVWTYRKQTFGADG